MDLEEILSNAIELEQEMLTKLMKASRTSHEYCHHLRNCPRYVGSTYHRKFLKIERKKLAKIAQMAAEWSRFHKEILQLVKDKEKAERKRNPKPWLD